ncbi:alpha/beta hydrolase family protein [Streptomyces buecherae]|uniref:alpha/beta hydrolase family protein n=1 Tax=Streptomyces buecherae TaxID=2763006 RepID=UPI001C25A80E|nr:chlorophyllase [Streptomyces buecherae]
MSDMTQSSDAALGAPTPVLSVSPVVLPTPERAVDLELRVSAPVGGTNLPVLLLSHGQGYSNHLSSLNGYAPLAHFWAAHGFVVLQPTHLSSRSLHLPPDTPGGPMHWRSRAEDMTRVLDRLDEIEAAVPHLAGRLDRERVAVAGHSMGGHTASLLLGARYVDPRDGGEVILAEPRIRAGVLLAAPGRGGDALVESAAEFVGFLTHTDYATMTTPALVVIGDRDDSSHLTHLGPAWHADPYALAPAPKTLLTLHGGEHGLGGVSGYDVAETTDDSPERVSAVQHLTCAYLRSQLYAGDPAWQTVSQTLTTGPNALGQVESK